MDFSKLIPSPPNYDAMVKYLNEIGQGKISPPLTRPAGLPDNPKIPTLEFGEGGGGMFRGRGSYPLNDNLNLNFGLTRFPEQKPSPYFGIDYSTRY